ncbi:hypothetical protein [Actinomyces faecalis]|uniref:hypothetical protein n=1 Tax=Actinomyces faecalis TaxID=2722820 RepID=UPI001557511C|nr:hypothetical protein [Actinomyces faecalis]
MRSTSKILVCLLAGCAAALLRATPSLPSVQMAVTVWTSWLLAVVVTVWTACPVRSRDE